MGDHLPTPGTLFYEALRRLEHECYLGNRGSCSGRLQGHHVIWQRFLRDKLAPRLGLPVGVLLSDARNGILLCEHHHAGIHSGFEVFGRADCALRFSAFEAQFQLAETFASMYAINAADAVRPRIDHSSRERRNASPRYGIPRTA